jgi:aspartyl-tRNA(Asn)/glutamyl-tRNA(Gln) amidotransferase subunit A
MACKVSGSSLLGTFERFHTRRFSVERNAQFGKRLSLVEASKCLNTQRLSVHDLVEACFKSAAHGEEVLGLGAYAERASWSELEQAINASQQRYDEGKPKSPLDGIPIAIKANIAVRGYSLNAGSRILHNRTAGSRRNSCGYDADITHRLLQECGAILIGTTRLDEFGMGSLGTHHNAATSSCDTVTHNPIHYLNKEDRQIESSSFRLAAGGSSSGSAVAVSHGSALLAIGTDTGGSIRLPASWCPGVNGYKPTYGGISRYGVVSYASSLDTVGALAANPSDIAFAHSCLINREDSICRDGTACFFSGDQISALSNEYKCLEGVVVGIPEAFSIEACPAHVATAWEKAAATLADAGASIRIVPQNVVQPSTLQASLSSYYVLACAEASSNLVRYDGVRFGANLDELLDTYRHDDRGGDDDSIMNQSSTKDHSFESQISAIRALGFGSEVTKRVLAGTAVLSSDRFHSHYEAAAKQRSLLRREFEEAFESDVDVMLVPTTIAPPPWITVDANITDNAQPDGTELLANDVMTIPISLAGLPAVSVPVALDNNMAPNLTSPDGRVSVNIRSVGFQIFGPAMSDSNVLRIATALCPNASNV